MQKLVLHPTDTAQWQALVNEAQNARALDLGEELESYLVFLLMRFVSQPEIASSIVGMDFLEGSNLFGTERQEKLREVGDKCLLFSGLFPGRAEKRRVKISYFVNIGQSAYGTISTNTPDKIGLLFSELCERFVSLMDVLQTMRELSGESKTLLPLDALELWEDTGSRKAFEEWQKICGGRLDH